MSLDTILQTYHADEAQREKDDTNALLGHDIAHTMMIVSLLESTGQTLEKSQIIQYCHGYSGSKVFDLVDAIMAKNIKKALQLIRHITSVNKVDEWLPSLV